MAKRYQRYSRGGSFKKPNVGDLGLRSYKEQQEQIIEALKFQRLRSKEYGQQQLTGMKNVARNEEENKRLIKEMEDKAYKTRLDALSVRNKRDIEAIKGQAKLAANESQYWLNFSTTYSKQWGKLAEGITKFADYQYAKHVTNDPEWKKKNEAFFSQLGDLSDIASKDNKKATSANSDNAEVMKETNKFQLFNSNNFQEVVKTGWERKRDEFHERYKSITAARYDDDNNLLQKSTYSLSSAERYVDDYFEEIGLNPNSPAANSIRNTFTQMVRSEINGNIDYQQYLTDKDDLIKFIQTFEATPTAENFHDIVQHVRTMYRLDDNNNVVKPPGNLPRNPADSWLQAQQFYLQFSSKDNPIRFDYETFLTQTARIPLLPKDGTGEISNELFFDKHKGRIDLELQPIYQKKLKELTKGQEEALELKTLKQPLSKIQAEVSELGRDATILNWSPGGWIEEKLNSAKGNHELESAIHELVGYNPAKHRPFAAHKEIMYLALNPTEESSNRLLYLINLVPSGKIDNYANITGIAENAQEYVASGVYTNSYMKSWAKGLVDAKHKQHNIEKGSVENNAKLTVEKLEEYRHMVFNGLNKKDFKSAKDRMHEAQRLTEIEFDKGLPKTTEEGASGTGYFKATVPAGGARGQMTVVWNGWDGDDPNINKKIDYTDMIEKFSNEKSVTNVIESGQIITRDTSTKIVSDIIEGDWDGKIPENVKTFAALKGWDEKYALNYILKTQGYNVQVPVDSYDQLKASGFTVHMDDLTKGYYKAGEELPKTRERHVASMMFWRSYVKEMSADENWRPQIGPINNPDFNNYKEYQLLAKKTLDDGTLVGYKVRNRQEENYREQKRVGGTEEETQEWGPGGQPSASKQINTFEKSKKWKNYFESKRRSK